MPTEMNSERALVLTQAWCKRVREPFDNVSVSPNGDFRGVFGAAEIFYSSQEKRLRILGLVVYDASLMVKRSEFFDEVKRAGDREPSTLGEGYFFLEKTPYKAEAPQLTLRKDFTDGVIKPEQFIKEVDWLMDWATYWRKQRYHQVSEESEEQLIREAPEIESWAKKNRLRPW